MNHSPKECFDSGYGSLPLPQLLPHFHLGLFILNRCTFACLILSYPPFVLYFPLALGSQMSLLDMRDWGFGIFVNAWIDGGACGPNTWCISCHSMYL